MHFLALPNELLLPIGEALNSYDLNSVLQVNRRLFHLFTSLLYNRAVQGLPVSLFDAAFFGNEHLIKFLSRHPDTNTSMINTALYYALSGANANQTNAIEILLENGAGINFRNPKGETPLFRAVTQSEAATKLLLENGADIAARDKNGGTILHLTVKRPNGVFRYILNYCGRGDVIIDMQDRSGKTALHEAAMRGSQDAIQLLVDHGCDVDAQDKKGNTALHLTAQLGHQKAVELLLDSGASLDLLNYKSRTPLRAAVANGQHKVVKLILEKRVYTDCRDSYSEGTLELAVLEGHVGIVQALLEKGIDTSVPQRREYGGAALYEAVKNGDEEIAELLLRRLGGAGMGCRDKGQNTTLHWAAAHGQTKIVEMLLENGAGVKVGKINHDGYTAGQLAWKRGNVAIATRLNKEENILKPVEDFGDWGAGTKLEWESDPLDDHSEGISIDSDYYDSE